MFTHVRVYLYHRTLGMFIVCQEDKYPYIMGAQPGWGGFNGFEMREEQRRSDSSYTCL